MYPNSSNSPFSAHQDVLEAIVPEEAAQKTALLEELKRRGKGAVGAQIWPDAVALYSKALEATDSDGEKAILKSNIALSQGKMGKWRESMQAAREAVGLDASYVKGWWRLGQANAALGDPASAVEALERALAIEPNNKSLQKELGKMQAMKLTEPTTKPKPTNVNHSSTTTKKEGLATAESTSQTPMEVDEEAQFTKSDHVKGYKIVNGKKTSFFHNELSEEAAKLIGDIAPKKLETQPAAEPTVQHDGSSVWNKAGTWEGTTTGYGSVPPSGFHSCRANYIRRLYTFRKRLY
jgi:tetratricopeptide (TPR) repeat protein